MSHYTDCPAFGAPVKCNCEFRYAVVQVLHDGTTRDWGWSKLKDGGKLCLAASRHPETVRVHVRDRVDGGLSLEVIPHRRPA